MEEKYMKEALRLARLAARDDEVPVGAVIVHDGKIIARGRNRREGKKNAVWHAEIEAIQKACKSRGGWRLFSCDMYVTLEPCLMCAGAAINARMDNVYFGAYDEKAGAFGSKIDANGLSLNHKVNVVGGVLQGECQTILSDFFKRKR